MRSCRTPGRRQAQVREPRGRARRGGAPRRVGHRAEVARVGAEQPLELAAAGLASILVPFPAAVDDHQTENARYLASRGAAVLLPEATLSADRLAQELRRLLGADARCRVAMAEAARKAAVPGAAQQLADLCLAAAGVRA